MALESGSIALALAVDNPEAEPVAQGCGLT